MSTKSACPKCGATIVVPEHCDCKKGKCPSCREILLLDELKNTSQVTNDQIMAWLNEAEPRRTEKPRVRAHAGNPSGNSPAEADKHFDLRLDHIDDMGAFFLFNSELLYDEDFRSIIPRTCIICGRSTDLSVQLITWPVRSNGSYSSTPTQVHSPCVTSLSKLGNPGRKGLLKKLPHLQHIPEPFSLPMPYYVCSSCSAVGALFTDVRPNNGDGGMICEIGFSSLKRAQDFAAAACGQDHAIVKRLNAALNQGTQHQWNQLPLAVRNRIGQWFKIADKEEFVVYIPDADFTKAEAGLAGVILTDRRLVYHKSLSLKEISLKDPIRITSKHDGNNLLIKIVSRDTEIKNFKVTNVAGLQLENFLKRTLNRNESKSKSQSQPNTGAYRPQNQSVHDTSAQAR